MNSPRHEPSDEQQPHPPGNISLSRRRTAIIAIAILAAVAGAVIIYAIILRHQTVMPTMTVN